MESIFKKLIYTGIGLASITRERLQKNIDDLVSNQKLSKEEGKKIVDDVMEKTATKRDEFESQFNKIKEEVMDKFNFASAKDFEALQRRVEALEIKLGRMDSPPQSDQDIITSPETVNPDNQPQEKDDKMGVERKDDTGKSEF